MVPLGFMSQGEVGMLAEIRGQRHHEHGGIPVPHAGPAKGYKRGHMFHSDRGHRLEHRLQHMGLVPGARVKVVQNNAPGPVIVAVKDTRVCLGRGVANRVMVELDGQSGRAAGPADPGGAPPVTPGGDRGV